MNVAGVVRLLCCALLVGAALLARSDAVYVRYRRCGPRLVCTALSLCPRQARMLHRTADVAAALELLSKTLCALHDSTLQVCCHETFALVPMGAAGRSVGVDVPPTSGAPGPAGAAGAARHPSLRLLNQHECGVGIKNRGVVGVGRDTVPGEFPWLALLQYQLGDGRLEFRCAGTLISDRYVLTAAQCVVPDNFSHQLVSVRVGEHDLSTAHDCALNGAQDEEGVMVCAHARPRDLRVEKVTLHPGYEPRAASAHDIALVRLREQLRLKPHFAVPVCLPLSGPLPEPLTERRLDLVSWRLDAPTSPFATPRRQSVEASSCGEGTLCVATLVCDVTPGTPATTTLGNLLTTRVAVLVGVAAPSVLTSATASAPGGCDAQVVTRIDEHLGWILDSLEE